MAKSKGKTGAQKMMGPQKAAVLMVALSTDTASEVFKHLDDSDVELISTEISRVKSVGADDVDDVLDEYYNLIVAQEYMLEGGIEYAQAVLEKSFGINKAMEIIEKVKSLTALKGFDVLKNVDSSQLVNFLSKEHPQTIALILSHLQPDQTAEALKELPEDTRAEVAFRIATLGKISPQTLKQIEKVVDELAGFTLTQSISRVGGARSLATILNRTSSSISKDILTQMDNKDPDIATQVKRLMFLFDDIINIQNQDIQKVLKEIDRKDLALSMKIADERVKNKIFTNMSERASDLLKEELEFMGPVKLKEVEQAQTRIIDRIKELEEQEEISLNIGGGAEEVYV